MFFIVKFYKINLARDPDRFNTDWYNKTCQNIEESSNWRVKGITLKKILKSLTTYFTEMTGHLISDENLPDVTLAGTKKMEPNVSFLFSFGLKFFPVLFHFSQGL